MINFIYNEASSSFYVGITSFNLHHKKEILRKILVVNIQREVLVYSIQRRVVMICQRSVSQHRGQSAGILGEYLMLSNSKEYV